MMPEAAMAASNAALSPRAGAEVGTVDWSEGVDTLGSSDGIVTTAIAITAAATAAAATRSADRDLRRER